MDCLQFQVTSKVIAAFEKLGITYAVGGSIASSAYGLPRSTNDADVVASISVTQAAGLVAELQSEFYVPEEAVQRAVRAGQSFNLIHSEAIFKIDVFVAKPGGFGESQLERRQLGKASNESPEQWYLVSPEDCILAKLDWYRRGNEVSDRQWQDVQCVIRVQAEALDQAYLRKWAGELKVADLLSRAFDEAGVSLKNSSSS
jgi:hypothetical protein